MIGDSVISMKATSVIFFSLFSAATAYAPCALQAEFDTVMCKSFTCKKCVGMDFCTDKCIGYQKKYPLCRCVEWPCSRRCYDDKACPNDEDLVKCWTTTTTTTTTTTPAPELVKEILDLADKVEKGEITKEEFVEKLVESGDANEEMAEEMAEEVDSGKLSSKEIAKEMTEPNNQPEKPMVDKDGDGQVEYGEYGDGNGELDDYDYDYGDGEEGEWVDPFAGENEWETDKKQGDDSDGQLGLHARKGKHHGHKGGHHGKKHGHKGKHHGRHLLARFLKRHRINKKLGLIGSNTTSLRGVKRHHAEM
jgi:hypothetical protein